MIREDLSRTKTQTTRPRFPLISNDAIKQNANRERTTGWNLLRDVRDPRTSGLPDRWYAHTSRMKRNKKSGRRKVRWRMR